MNHHNYSCYYILVCINHQICLLKQLKKLMKLSIVMIAKVF